MMKCIESPRRSLAVLTLLSSLTLTACALSPSDKNSAANYSVDDSTGVMTVTGTNGETITGRVLSNFDKPWAMTFLPDGRALVTEKAGVIWLVNSDGSKAGQIYNGPAVTARGQGGLGDIIIHPGFGGNGLGRGVVYLSYVERDPSDDELNGAVVERAVLDLNTDGGELNARQIIWSQSPKVTGNGHYSHRLVFSDDGHLFITSGERQKFSPSQNMAMNLGKIIRVDEDGIAPTSNPFYGNGAVSDQIWSLGHRNVLGIDFDAEGQLWAHEMGPKGGDELNRIVRAENYGYPDVSDGQHYSGKPFKSHESNPVYENPALSWTPVISPSGFVIYDGDRFESWTGNGLIGGLSAKALIRVAFEEAPLDNTGAPPSTDTTETIAREVARYSWDKRIREVE